MSLIDSLGKTSNMWKSNADVAIKLGNGNTNIDIAANSAQISLGDGDIDVNADLFSGMLLEAGDGKHEVTANAGGNVIIGLGFDCSNIVVNAGGSVFVDTECGDQNVLINAGQDVQVDTGCCGKDNVVIKAGGNAVVNTAESDDNIFVDVAGRASISAGTTDPEALGDNDTVYLKAGGYGNYVSLGDGSDTAAIFADGVQVDKNIGDLTLGILGNVAQINSKADKNIIGAYGDNYEFNLNKSADNDVRSLDFWLRDGEDGKKVLLSDNSQAALKDLVDDVHGQEGYTLTEYDKKNNAAALDFFKSAFGSAFDAMTRSQSTSEIICQRVETTGMTKDEIADRYNLSDEERAILKSVDLSAKFGNTDAPAYFIALSPKKSKAAGKDVYVVVKADSTDGNYVHGRAESDKECIAIYLDGSNVGRSNCYCGCVDTSVKAEELSGSQITKTKYAEMDNWTTFGVANWSINLKDDESGCGCGCGCGKNDESGSLMANISARAGYISINGEAFDSGNKVTDINIIGGHRDSIITKFWETEKEDWAITAYVQRNSWNSPLILDMNGDGEISSTAGIGVDIDGDGKADGAASNGDKMLAMSDINGNGKIDGTEVFGNNTVSPFTGEKLNAANGFEALRMIAQEAVALGYNCMNGGEVDMAILAKALKEKANVQLGFISGSNASQVEALSGVKAIDTGYIDTTLESGAQRQHGSFVWENGKLGIVDDVWFQNAK